MFRFLLASVASDPPPPPPPPPAPRSRRGRTAGFQHSDLTKERLRSNKIRYYAEHRQARLAQGVRPETQRIVQHGVLKPSEIPQQRDIIHDSTRYSLSYDGSNVHKPCARRPSARFQLSVGRACVDQVSMYHVSADHVSIDRGPIDLVFIS